jgi:hypothetical protein
MANDKPKSGGAILQKGHQPRPTLAQDGHKPRPITEGHQPRPAAVTIPNKVQGGYQAPAGGGKPAVPTTGSGVTPKPAAPTGKK